MNDLALILIIAYFVIVAVIIAREPRTRQAALVPGDLVYIDNTGRLVAHSGLENTPIGIVVAIEQPSVTMRGTIRI